MDLLGDFPTHERFVRDLVVDSGFTAIFASYTPSPEAQYPTAISEIPAAAKWVAAHGAEIRVDASRLGIVGNSVGGNLTAAVALLALHKGGPKFKCRVHALACDERRVRHRLVPRSCRGLLPLARHDEVVLGRLHHRPRTAPGDLRLPAPGHEGTTRRPSSALVPVAGADVLRDEGLAYARNLDAAGVDVTVVRYERLIHDYGLLNALSQVPAVRDALHQASEMLKKHL